MKKYNFVWIRGMKKYVLNLFVCFKLIAVLPTYWIGLSYDSTIQEFVWDSGASYSNSQARFGVLEPSDAGECVVAMANGLWYSADCTVGNVHKAVCEIN